MSTIDPGTDTSRTTSDTESTLVVTARNPAGFSASPMKRLKGATLQLTSLGKTIEFMYAPNESEMQALAQPSSPIERKGRMALVRPSGEPVPEFSFTATLGYNDPDVSVEDHLFDIEAIAKTGDTVTINFGGMNRNPAWRITSLGWKSKMRNIHGHVTRADVDITLTRCADAEVRKYAITSGQPVESTPPLSIPGTGTDDSTAGDAYDGAGVTDPLNPDPNATANPTETAAQTAARKTREAKAKAAAELKKQEALNP